MPRKHGFISLALTGLSTSIDALAVGVGLAFVDVPIVAVAVVIGLCTFGMVTLGVMLGRMLSAMVGRGAELAGGVVLIGVGAVILYEHLSA
jgi:putative Mn2+ efflux pump MntP